MTNITQQEIIEIAKEAGFEVHDDNHLFMPYVWCDDALIKFAQLIEARLAARSDDRQSGEAVATVIRNHPEHKNSIIIGTALPVGTKLFTAPQQAIPAETKYIWEYKLDGEPDNIYETEPMTNEEFRVFNIDKLIHYERGAPIAAPSAPIDKVHEALEAALVEICVKCRSNEWGTLTPRKEILNWMHDKASSALTLIPSTQAPNTGNESC